MATVIHYVAVLLLVCVPLVRSVVYTDGKTVVEWRSAGQDSANGRGVSCFLYDIRKKTWPGTSPGVKPNEVRITNSTQMSVLEDECVRAQRSHFMRQNKRKVKRSVMDFLWGIYPGTKWCGKGNVATDETDLGPFWRTDACCRDHDTKCAIYLLSGETKYGTTNNEIYVVNDCRCDSQFHDCLQRANTLTSNNVGDLFFNIIRVKCLHVTSADNGTVTGNIEGIIQEPQPYQSGTIASLLSGLVYLDPRVIG